MSYPSGTVKLTGKYEGFNFTSVSLHTMSDNGVFTSQTKKQAKAFALQHGWKICDVSLAHNRFMTFYIVGQQQGTNIYRTLCKNGEWVDLALDTS